MSGQHDTKRTSRRSFLKTAAKAGAAAVAAPLIVPRRVLGGPGYLSPSDTLNIAAVGVGGVGKRNVKKVAETENIVALADVDHDYAAEVLKEYPGAAKYYDYRRMFDDMGDQIDGVIVATPDHTHAVIAMEAMERGKHVYVQKPLTWSVAEARALARAAERTGVVTQMGNQGHSSDDARLINEYIRDGAIGTVEEVHVWTNRPIWPQGVEEPTVQKRRPDRLRWDLFLGPAPEESYDPAFHPFRWRGWVDYGTGALGDMGAHLIDHPYWALELGEPEAVQTRSTSFNGESWPNAAVTYYDFPARGNEPPVRLTWYDGGLKPPRPEALARDKELNPNGALFIGSEGALMHDVYGRNPTLLPTALMEEYPEPPQLFPRIEDENHEQNWVRAIKGKEEATSNFAYASRLTETMLLGMVSLRAGGRRIRYDADRMKVTNLPAANRYLQRQNPREGWSL